MKKGYIWLGVFTLLIIVLLALTFSNLSNTSTQDSQSSSSTQRYVGSRNSDVYHYLSCGYAGRIKSGNKIYFSSSQDARNHGYRPCKVCKPP